ncbi:hypothetical protein [Tenacibaculum sp. SDUM215027]|uniref:hypothetical protein n=1 Tax=Tenacibaculum sp. SDUM215027 TaxID=3422596 RepID=UPI003D311953
MGKITIKAKNLYKIVEENYITKVGGTLTKRAEEINIATTEGSINMYSNTSIDMKAENEIILGDYIEPAFSGLIANDNKVIAKFKPDDTYKGEFGFDWCEWDLQTGEIEKFQDTKLSDIEYTFDDTEKKYKVATNENRQKILKLLYSKKTIDFGKQYYTAWMNLAKGNKATLKLTTIYLERKQKTENEEYISFIANDDYEISYDGNFNTDIKIPLKKTAKNMK